MKKKNIFWGVILILIALYIIFGGIFGPISIGLFSMILTVILIAIIINSLPQRNFWGILLPIAFLCIMYSDHVEFLDAITPWPVIWAAIFGSIGLSILFGDRPHHHGEHFHGEHYHDGNFGGNYQQAEYHQAQGEAGENAGTYEQNAGDKKTYENVINQPDPSYVDCRVKFGSCVKYVNCDDFRQADLSCSFGAMKVYFDHAFIKGSHAEIYLSASFGGIELYVPKEWNVVQNVTHSFGAIEEKFRSPASVDGPLVNVRGNVSFSGVTIIYI